MIAVRRGHGATVRTKGNGNGRDRGAAGGPLARGGVHDVVAAEVSEVGGVAVGGGGVFGEGGEFGCEGAGVESGVGGVVVGVESGVSMGMRPFVEVLFCFIK